MPFFDEIRTSYGPVEAIGIFISLRLRPLPETLVFAGASGVGLPTLLTTGSGWSFPLPWAFTVTSIVVPARQWTSTRSTSPSNATRP